MQKEQTSGESHAHPSSQLLLLTTSPGGTLASLTTCAAFLSLRIAAECYHHAWGTASCTPTSFLIKVEL